MIRKGNNNEEVRQWQEFLISLGYDLNPDGIFGSKTHQATVEFQASAELSDDGIVGKNTYARAKDAGYAGDYA
jgi:peptidoglycan hydrolase-like protein with peptidoglycan-binding domain